MEENKWNADIYTPNRPKRNDTRSSSHRNRYPRLDSSYIDDATLNAMITNGMLDALGPVHFAEFRASTRQAMAPTNSNVTNGWTPECRFEWRINSSYTNQAFQDKEDNTKFKNLQKDQLAELAQKEISSKKDSRFLLQKLIMEEDGSSTDPAIASQRQESIMQWFDRAVERELQRRRDTSLNGNLPTGLAETIMPAKDLNLPKSLIDKMAEATASRIETVSQMSMIPDTELSDVVDKFAKAEAMCAFAGAVKAAEAAAEAAPPELAEEAALASARIYQSELNATEIKEEFSGIRPMEVIGYIGVTKPKHPVKSEKK
ncbi:unnamed protein product [Diabrotica balteata]|uniref:Uncharacterized protein n=1 Tax=Diabrotica balteata TaxID=107213 RepID=A0A9N9XCK0_DIABA|nr:unnamed protein product [Diabrotica balteata]